MRTKDQVLSDVIANPGRDDLRLEYAAVVEAKDPELADYIRTLVNMAPRRTVFRNVRPGAVQRRMSAPFLRHCYAVDFWNGFIDSITIDPYVFIERGHELLAMAPIWKVTFMPKPLEPDQEPPPFSDRVPSAVPEIMACPHLERVKSIEFVKSNCRLWTNVEPSDVECVLRSRYLATLRELRLPGWGSWLENQPDAADSAYWRRAYARPEFRKMLTLQLPRYPGESVREYDQGPCTVREATPMPAIGRALEREHGYLPALHQHNRWGDDPSYEMHPDGVVLGAMRGELPKFPVGAPVTEAMYVLPPPKSRQTMTDWG